MGANPFGDLSKQGLRSHESILRINHLRRKFPKMQHMLQHFQKTILDFQVAEDQQCMGAL